MPTRAKFRVTGIDLRSGMAPKKGTEKTEKPVWESVTLPTVRLSPISPAIGADETAENEAFWNATPTGKIELTITNPDAAETFELSRDYYVDFTPAD